MRADIVKAMEIAWSAHREQKDKGGNPYIQHPLTVASKQDTENGMIVALLHDVVEDSAYTIDDLKEIGFSAEVCEAVDLLTHKRGENYSEYIQKIKMNELARKVKIQDLTHNMDTTRLGTLTEKDRERMQKYKAAFAILAE